MLNLYTVKDLKAGRCAGVVCFPNDAMARRAFASAVNSDVKISSLLNEYPEDAVILKIATFDEETGTITATSVDVLCVASELLNRGE